jgi:hypothetical protein
MFPDLAVVLLSLQQLDLHDHLYDNGLIKGGAAIDRKKQNGTTDAVPFLLAGFTRKLF